MFKKILVPTDGSSHAVKAERLGADLASKYGAELIFLSVIEDGSLTPAAKQLAARKGIDLSPLIDAPGIAVFSPEGAPVVPKAEVNLASLRIQAERAELLIGEAVADTKAAAIEKVTGLTGDGDVADAILQTASANGGIRRRSCREK